MSAPHLFNAMRMIFNHSAPAELRTLLFYDSEIRLGMLRERSDVRNWSDEYRAAALASLSEELVTRNLEDLPPGSGGQLRWMVLVARLAAESASYRHRDEEWDVGHTERCLETISARGCSCGALGYD